MDFTTIMPKLQVSMNTNADEKDKEDQEFNMLCRAKIELYIAREDMYSPTLLEGHAEQTSSKN